MNGNTGRRSRLVAMAMPVAAVLLLVLGASHPSFRSLPLLQPDSATYLDGNIARSPAYPLLLRVMSTMPGGHASIGPVQHVAVLSAGVFMASSFATLYGSPMLALGLAAAVLANPAVVSYCYTILPEAFFMAALMLHLGCVMRFARDGDNLMAAGAGASAALAAMFRPVGFALIAALAVVALQHRHRIRALALLGGAATALVFTAAALNYAVRGVFATQSQGGYSRAAYTAVLLDPTPVPPYPELTARIGEGVAAHRAALFAIGDLQLEALIGSNEYHVVETLVHDEVLNQIARERGGAVTDRGLFPRDPDVVLALNRIGSWLSGVAIREHAGLYARMVAVNVAALWWQPLIQSSSSIGPLRARLDAVLAAHPVLGQPSFPFRVMSPSVHALVRLILAAAIVCGVAGVLSVFSTDPRRQVIAHVSVLVHGYFVGVSTAQPGLPRYAIAIWPASMLVVFGTAAVWARLSRARER